LTLQGAPIENNPLGQNWYLRNYNRFCHRIDSYYRGRFRPYMQKVTLQYLVLFNKRLCYRRGTAGRVSQ